MNYIYKNELSKSTRMNFFILFGGNFGLPFEIVACDGKSVV